MSAGATISVSNLSKVKETSKKIGQSLAMIDLSILHKF